MLAAHQILSEHTRVRLPLGAVRRHVLIQFCPTASTAAGRHCVSLAVALAAVCELVDH
jgi:hypothetical protein